VNDTSNETGPVMLTSRQLADRWGMSVGHLANLRCQAKGPAFRRFGGAVRYALADVIAFEQEALVPTDDQASVA
jgi:hypothetical protein